jgi:hypothetical protein
VVADAMPKADGGTRPLGIPTVADRIAQEVARRYLEPCLEPVFHTDSYGYRPGRSAIDAVRQARQRCWRYDWVLDIDVKAYFDSIDWERSLKAVRHHTDCPWVLLYIERWLKAPVQMEDGSVVPRTAGTPQGGVPALCVRRVDVAKLSAHSVGEFGSYDEWARLGPQPPYRTATFIDAQGRRCITQCDFARARDDRAFPLRYRWETTKLRKRV